MAVVPRMSHEGWPTWTKFVFVVLSIVMVVLGVLSIIMSKHTGGGVLGAIVAVIGLLYLFGLIISPRWIDDPI